MATSLRTEKMSDLSWLKRILCAIGIVMICNVLFRAYTVTSAADSRADSLSRSQRDISVLIDDTFPWQVKLRLMAALRCSGVLLDSSWVLTAASCFNGNYQNPGSYFIELYPPNHRDTSQSSTTTATVAATSTLASHRRDQTHVQSFYLHGRYLEGQTRHNLALVQLRTNMTSQAILGDVIERTDDVGGLDCVTVGWGSNGTEEPVMPRVRQWKTLNSTECSRQYNITVDMDQLCALLQHAHTGTCTGDTGAPLMCRRNGTWKVTGVVTQNWRCHDYDQDPQPVRFLSVKHYLPFIEKRGHFKNIPSKP